jgi:hypothetical protein
MAYIPMIKLNLMVFRSTVAPMIFMWAHLMTIKRKVLEFNSILKIVQNFSQSIEETG